MYAKNIRIKLDKDEKNVNEKHNPEHIEVHELIHIFMLIFIDLD